MISGQDLKYFIELTQTLNFSRAAERCGISQPSLSAAIKRLEILVGTELFIRSKHKVCLTQSGKNLLSHSKRLLELWETTKARCLFSKNEVQGSVTLGCHLSLALYFLPTVLPGLLNKYSDLEIKLKHDLSRKITEEVINFSVDIGIVVNPVKHPDLIIKKLYTDEVGCWHAKHLTFPHDNANILICDPDLHQTQYILKKIHNMGIRYKRMITTNNLEMIAHLTASGTGIGIVPAKVVKSLSAEVKLLDESPLFHDEICVVYRHENANIKAVREVLKYIKKISDP